MATAVLSQRSISGNDLPDDSLSDDSCDEYPLDEYDSVEEYPESSAEDSLEVDELNDGDLSRYAINGFWPGDRSNDDAPEHRPQPLQLVLGRQAITFKLPVGSARRLIPDTCR